MSRPTTLVASPPVRTAGLWMGFPVVGMSVDLQEAAVRLAAIPESDALYAVFGIAVLFVVFALVVARVEGLGFMAPRASKGLHASVHAFCVQRCRIEGRCPLTGTGARAERCPLWRYVDSDLPLVLHGSPFEPARLPSPPESSGAIANR